MVERVKSAVLVGYGSIGRYHARLLDHRYEQLAISDIDETALNRARDDFQNVATAHDLSELDTLNWPWESTMAVIATWGPSHSAIFAELADLGVKYILCEKPLANSVKSGAAMTKAAERLGITLGVHQHLRYSGFVDGLNQLSKELELGDPVSIVFHGGALGIVTNGIHIIDLASEIFGRGPEQVFSNATADLINPRSSELELYWGTAAWSFGGQRQACLCFSNLSSVSLSINIYYRDAMVEVLPDFDVKIGRRDRADVEKSPGVTSTGHATDIAFTGPVPGFLRLNERTIMLLEEIEAGNVKLFPPALAVQALGACIGALASGKSSRAIQLPIDPESELAELSWPIS